MPSDPSVPSGTRTPPGKTRASWYVSATEATAFDEAADTIVANLGGIVPKHVAVAELLHIAVDHQADAINRIRARLAATIAPGEPT